MHTVLLSCKECRPRPTKAERNRRTTKPAFKDAWKWGQRCLVVTDGFYEWKKGIAVKEKQPYAIAMADDGMMVMAGLWSR